MAIKVLIERTSLSLTQGNQNKQVEMNKPGQFELLDLLEANWPAHRFFILIGPEFVTDFPLYWGVGRRQPF